MIAKTPERKAQEAANARAWRAANKERARDIDRRCKEKNAETVKATKQRCYAKHREQNLAYAAAYRAENAERIKAATAGKHSQYSQRYRDRNPDKCRDMAQAWKEANPEQRKVSNARWSKANLHKHRTYQHNRRAKIRENGGTLTPDLAKRLMILQRGRCACCGEKLIGGYDMDHIVPLALGGTNTDGNIQLLTTKCNRQKGAKPPIEFMQSRGMLL